MLNELVVPTVELASLRITTGEEPMVITDVCDWHFHNEYEMVLSLEGKRTVIVGSTEHHLDVGDILFINRKVPHKSITYPGSRAIVLQFKNPFVNEEELNSYLTFLDFRDANDTMLFKTDDMHHKQLCTYMTNIAAEYSQKQLAYEEFIRGYLHEMVAYLYRHRVIINYVGHLSHSDMQRITPALEYINTHYHEQISLESISKLLLIDKSHFCRIFKKSMNMTFVDYLNSVRIYHAEMLLTKTKKSITEISFKVGFSSTAYFIKAFKRYNFCTPSKYRKMFLESRKSQ